MEELLTFGRVLAELKARGVCVGEVKPTEYHAMKPLLEKELGVPVVSKSGLCDFMRSAYRYKWELEHGVRKSSEALSLGSLADCLALTPEAFEEQYMVEEKRVALKKDGTPYSNGMQDPEQKARWAAAEAEGVTVISPEQFAKGEALAGQVRSHLLRYGLELGKSFKSQVAMWVYLTELDGVELACPVVVCGMIDILPEQGNELWDMKTTSEDVCNTKRLGYTTEDYGYGVQAAMYIDLYNLAAGAEREAFTFLFVGTKEPYMSRCVHMTAEVVELYRAEYRRGLRAFCVAWKTGDWGEAALETHIFMPSAGEWKRLQKGEMA